MVTHDRYLVNRLATQIWELRDGRIHLFAGNYQEYLLARSEQTEKTRQMKSAAAETTASSNGSSLSKNEQRKRAATISSLEKQVHEAEMHVQTVTEQLQNATAESAFDKIQTLSIEYEQAQATLEALVAAWEQAHEPSPG